MRKTLIKTDMYNVFKECDEGDESLPLNTNPTVHEFMRPLLDELSNKRPEWTFISTSYVRQSGHDTFDIIFEGEKLGALSRTHNWRTNEQKYSFDSPRLRAARQRGNATETKDAKKAAKLILANMYPTTPAEFMRAQRDNTKADLGRKMQRIHWDYRAARDAVMPVLESFALGHVAMLKEYAPIASDSLDKLAIKQEDLSTARTVEDLLDKGKVVVIHERGNKFYLEHGETEGTFISCSLDELLPHYKQVVGVLKLSAVGTLIPDLGFRVSENTFAAFDIGGEDGGGE